SVRSSTDVFLLLSSRLLGPLVVMRALSAEARASAEAGGSVEALVLVFFFVAMWSCRNELRVGAKTVGVGYPSERRSITTAHNNKGEAKKENDKQGNGKKIKPAVITHSIQYVASTTVTRVFI